MAIPEEPTKSENVYYSTFQDRIDPTTGSFEMSDRLKWIATQKIQGIFKVDLIHCTYLIKSDFFEKIDYNFRERNYEYRNFALSMHYHGVPQYIDARFWQGSLTLSEALEESKKILDDLTKNPQIVRSYSHDESASGIPLAGITISKNNHRQIEFVNRHQNLCFQWNQGIDSSTVNYDLLKESGLISHDCSWDRPSIANALSHRSLWEEVVLSDRQMVIFEDDAIFVNDFGSKLDDFLELVPQDYDLVYLGFNWDSFVFVDLFDLPSGVVKMVFDQTALQSDLHHIQAIEAAPHPIRLRAAFGICGYLISPKGAKVLLDSTFPLTDELINPPKIPWTLKPQTLDSVLNKYHSLMENYISFPPLIYVGNSHQQSSRLNSK
jgi:GR25 family glycosyltransferase involved in LPS biosynthesis